MKIGVAQSRPVKGDITRNIAGHKKLIDLAVASGAAMIVFPELSITGYEPELAKDLATDTNDKRFNDFQQISNDKDITIGIGMPLRNDTGVLIAMIIFQPQRPRQVYYKQHLHEDEIPYFISGPSQNVLKDRPDKISLAICYEISIPEHSANAFQNGSGIYLASVAKSVIGVEKAVTGLSEIARKYSMTVLMSNCIGHCDNFDCGGKSSIWNKNGELIGQLDDANEGILLIDTITQEIIAKTT